MSKKLPTPCFSVSLLVVSIAFIVVSAIGQETMYPREIKVPKGKASTIVRGTLAARGKGRLIFYFVNIKSGQRLRIKITSPNENAKFAVPKCEYAFDEEAEMVSEWEGQYPSKADLEKEYSDRSPGCREDHVSIDINVSKARPVITPYVLEITLLQEEPK